MIPVKKVTLPDFEEINLLLKSSDLPKVDTSSQTGYFFKIEDASGRISAAIGLEIYGKSGLLRSLVVEKSNRNKGLAHVLVNKMIEHAQTLGLDKLILLTTTADKYFEKYRFIRIDRNEVPGEVQLSPEFSSICPVSAIVMERKL